ncbi:hypothetical protein I4U23_013195 [Adineta vaga]|nr:hypothetical protein I4U23_013195 [Adineta vaga]
MDNYLYIVDCNQNRIVGNGPSGFQCIVGCSGASSPQGTLQQPTTMAFDNDGNILVVDLSNNRVQKFFSVSNGLATTTTTDTTTTFSSSAMTITTTDTSTVTVTTTDTTTTDTSTMTVTTTDTTTTSTSTTTVTTTDTTTTDTSTMTVTTTNTSASTSTMANTTTTTSIMLSANYNCQSPNITLFGNPSSLLSPLQYQRGQSVYLLSYLQLNCNPSLSTIIKWTLKQCSSTCSTDIQLDSSIITTQSELFIPSNSLDYGIYELKLSVTMATFPNSTSTALIYAKITPSNITANLIQFGTLMIAHGYQQDLLLNPGAYSIDPDSDTFNATNWNYDYYCRIFDRYSFPNINGTLLTIDDSRIDSLNPSCFANQSKNGSGLEYHGSILSPKSSLIILAGSFSSNETYQIMVHMTHRQNSSLTATGYVIVHVEETHSPLIAVACVISTMCIPNVEYQYMNPTTQAALFSVCVNNCSKADSISWNIYQGSVNVSSNVTQWSLFNQMNIYRDIWFFGINTNNFTATNQLFLANPSITYWRFEVVYWFGNRSSASALNFIMNQPPSNGSCSISPSNGTTSTLFTISCSNWFDADGIKDYSFYGWRTDQSDRVMIAFSMLSTNEVLLSGTNENGSLLHIVANIRDIYDCVTEYNISSVFVESNFEEIESFLNSTNNSFISMLASGNQNRISQIITSLSHEFNKINDQAIENALINGIPISTISISSLNSKTQQTSLSGVLNTTVALIEYNKQLNKYANARDLLIRYMTNLSITTIESIKLQSSSLAQFTKATNQLTRNSLTIVSNKCYELALALQMKSTRISSDDVQIVGRYLSECINNVLSSVNGPLQVRTSILDKDWSDANDFPIDYDTDLDSEWSNPSMMRNE